jgi:hypothetical protein
MRRYGLLSGDFVVWVETCDMKYRSSSVRYVYTADQEHVLPNSHDMLSSRS